MLSEASILKKLRAICRALPGVKETRSFGHPTFRVGKKTFAVLEEYKGELSLALKTEKELQEVFLKDARFYRTPYIGRHGWVSLRLRAAALRWREIAELLRGSHRLVSPKTARRA